MASKTFMLVALMVMPCVVAINNAGVANTAMRMKADTAGLTAPEAKVAPTAKVLQLLRSLKGRAEEDGKEAAESYDAYACWVEDRIKETAAAIVAEKELIESSQVDVEKLKGELASHEAEAKQVKKEQAANLASVKEATGMRNKEFAEYQDQKAELEQSIAALDSAIAVVNPKKGFLETSSSHEMKLLSVAGQVHGVVERALPSSIASQDIELVKRFIASPLDFFSPKSGAMSALQRGQDPFWANPAVTSFDPHAHLSGIFKGMYTAFTTDLEKANAEEAVSQKAFESLKGTKDEETRILKGQLEDQESFSGDKNQQLQSAQETRSTNVALLAADKVFFAKLKEGGNSKAAEWADQLRMRTKELVGMEKAIQTLAGGEDTFSRSFNNPTAATTDAPDVGAASLVQVSAIVGHEEHDGTVIQRAVFKLKELATKFKSLKFAKAAMALQAGGGVLDGVFTTLDTMIAALRREGQDDIKQRDDCENEEKDNANDLEDAGSVIGKSTSKISHMSNARTALNAEITRIQGIVNSTRTSRKALTNFRKKSATEFRQAIKNDREAMKLMRTAINAMTQFSRDKWMPRKRKQQNLMQMPASHDPEPEAEESEADVQAVNGVTNPTAGGGTSGPVAEAPEAVEPVAEEPAAEEPVAEAPVAEASGATAPEYSRTKLEHMQPKVSWSGTYDGRKGESSGIVAMLRMLVEDVKKEIDVGRVDEADAKREYMKQKSAMTKIIVAQVAVLNSMRTHRADLQENIVAAQEVKKQQRDDKQSEHGRQSAITTACAGVKSGFDERAAARKTEIDGLVDAKEYLAGGLPTQPESYPGSMSPHPMVSPTQGGQENIMGGPESYPSPYPMVSPTQGGQESLMGGPESYPSPYPMVSPESYPSPHPMIPPVETATPNGQEK